MVKFNNFALLDPAARELATELVEFAPRSRSPFLKFSTVWFAFNGWMECITDAATDSAMINAIAANDRIRAAFGALLDQEEFGSSVREFTRLWPVFNVRDMRRKLGRDALWEFSRTELIDACITNAVSCQPRQWDPRDRPTWEQVIRTIYMVRCNLFHGAKSPLSMRDQRLVRSSNEVLRGFIARSRCLEWSD